MHLPNNNSAGLTPDAECEVLHTLRSCPSLIYSCKPLQAFQHSAVLFFSLSLWPVALRVCSGSPVVNAILLQVFLVMVTEKLWPAVGLYAQRKAMSDEILDSIDTIFRGSRFGKLKDQL